MGLVVRSSFVSFRSSSCRALAAPVFAASFAALALVGCAEVDGGAAPALDEGSSALVRGEVTAGAAGAAGAASTGRLAGARLDYQCHALACSCQGDADCNDMFSGGACGDIAWCDDSGPVTECICLVFRERKADGSVMAPPGREVLKKP